MLEAQQPGAAPHAPTPRRGSMRAAPCAPRAGGAALEVEIASDIDQIERVVDAVVARCVALEYPRRACTLNVPVALTEAIANAILSGNREDRHKAVRVRACVDVEQLVLEVEDQGGGFDLEASTRGVDDADFLDREDGRGLFLMRRLMDRVERYAVDSTSNVVRMTLRRA